MPHLGCCLDPQNAMGLNLALIFCAFIYLFSHVVGPRHPFKKDPDVDYDEDSDEEWEEVLSKFC